MIFKIDFKIDNGAKIEKHTALVTALTPSHAVECFNHEILKVSKEMKKSDVLIIGEPVVRNVQNGYPRILYTSLN